MMMEKEKNGIDVNQILKQLGLAGKEEAIAKAIGDLTDEEKLAFLSFLYPYEDDNLATMYTISERYKLSWLRSWCDWKLKLRTSVSGWRSNQLVNIASEKRKEQARFGFLSRIFGKRKEEKGVEEIE
jgi:hypothetical protein